MHLEEKINSAAYAAVETLYGEQMPADRLTVEPTRDNFEGDLTITAFKLARIAQKAPPIIAGELGEYLKEHVAEIAGYNVVKGFLNLTISDRYWLEVFARMRQAGNYGSAPSSGEVRMVEYASPNTNKPLHVGHARNIFLGHSMARILEANGHEVKKVQIINDRGVHICMSMLAWERWGNGETPASSGLKGDKLVGNYYVKFNREYTRQTQLVLEKFEAGNYGRLNEEQTTKAKALQALIRNDEKSAKDKNSAAAALKDLAKTQTDIIGEAQAMLRKWETNDPEVRRLWEMMNRWVYEGFDATYRAMGVDFDTIYYESETYLRGKEEVLKGLEKGVFYQKEDRSVWADLTEDGLDHKLVLRGDGTAVYMTQDIGTAILRFEENPGLMQQIYTVGNEQEYHFKVLFLILEKLGYKMARNNYHLSYGMVELPTGKMKSREGKVADADDLMEEVKEAAASITGTSGVIDEIPEADHEEIFRKIGMGALKYFLLKVDPVKGMMFDPAASVELVGHTGPFIQYSAARIRSILRKYEEKSELKPAENYHGEVNASARELIILLEQFPAIIRESGEKYTPSTLANYAFYVAKQYNRFNNDNHVLHAEIPELGAFRAGLCQLTLEVLTKSLYLLGIEVPERM